MAIKKNLLGQKFHKLLVIEDLGRKSTKHTMYKCQCDCGRLTIVAIQHLTSGKIKSCGCLRTGPDIIGLRIGKLVVLSRADKNNTSHSYFNVRCDCGEIFIARKNELTQKSRPTRLQCPKCTKLKLHKKYKNIPIWLLNHIEKSAKDRNIEFNLTYDYLDDILVKQNFICILSGIKLTCGTIKDRKNCNMSLDRIDSRIGYVVGNVQWVDKDINRMKWVLSNTRFIEICNKVSNHVKSSGFGCTS